MASRSSRAVARRRLGGGEVAAARRQPVAEQAQVQFERLPLEPGVGLGRVRLLAQRPQARAGLALDVERAIEVGAGPIELELGAAAALAVLAEARGLLDQQPPLARLGEHDRLDLALPDDRVHLAAEARVGERLGDVGEADSGHR